MFGNGGLSCFRLCLFGRSHGHAIAHNFFLSFISPNLPSLRPLREIIFGFFLPLRDEVRKGPSPPNRFFCAASTLISPNLATLCAFAGDTSPEFFSRQHAKGSNHPMPCAGSVSFSITWSIEKLAAFWRGGNSLNVDKNCPTADCCGHEQVGVVEQPVIIGVRRDVGPLVRIGSQIEDLRHAQAARTAQTKFAMFRSRAAP